MTFYQSRAISKAGLHVRRSAWPDDKWFMLWRGTWFAFAGGNPPIPVKATDYSSDDLLATDWTTMPAALAACPIDPGTGSTGGGPPQPGKGGFPNDPTLFPFGGSGTPPDGGSTTLPPPEPGTGLTVKIAGLDTSRASSIWSGLDGINKSYTLSGSGDSWSTTFNKGINIEDSSDLGWTLTATRSGSIWDVELSPGAGSGGFQTQTPAGARGAGIPIANNYTSGSLGGILNFFGGTATVGAH